MKKFYRLMSVTEFEKYLAGEVIETFNHGKVFFVPENLVFSVDGLEMSGAICENSWFFDEFFYNAFERSFIVEFVADESVVFDQTEGIYKNVEYFFPGDIDPCHERIVVQEVTLDAYSIRELTATAVIEDTGFINTSSQAFVERVWPVKAL